MYYLTPSEGVLASPYPCETHCIRPCDFFPSLIRIFHVFSVKLQRRRIFLHIVYFQCYIFVVRRSIS